MKYGAVKKQPQPGYYSTANEAEKVFSCIWSKEIRQKKRLKEKVF